MKGWVSLHRKILDNDVIKFNKKFSSMEAWIWLILNVNYEDRKVVMGTEIYNCKRGQMITSQKKLCKVFGWGNSRLRTFLKNLQRLNKIEVESNTKLTCVTLLKYTTYQDNKPETNQKQTKDKLKTNTNNNINKTNKTNKEKSITKREEEFINRTAAVGLLILPMPEPSIIEAFCDYWTEKNISGRKMRFELGRTFDIGRRLKRWIRNNDEWNRDKNGVSQSDLKKNEEIREQKYIEQQKKYGRSNNIGEEYAKIEEVRNILKIKNAK